MDKVIKLPEFLAVSNIEDITLKEYLKTLDKILSLAIYSGLPSRNDEEKKVDICFVPTEFI